MSINPVIQLQNLSKAYRIWESPADRLLAPATALLGRMLRMAYFERRAARRFRDFWALKDVSFELGRGESLGIIGRNGSGKSTLLQIITGTLQPSSGSVRVQGKIAGLLELGSGFNPEFTGRENVEMNASILGLSRTELEARFESIANFAEIGDFMEQPVKTYSSGMMVRLAFAVQTAVEPEVLIIDEALAVGDEAFQRKCFARIEALRERGTTLLFVSHSAAQIIELCDRAVLLAQGEVQAYGAPKEVVKTYHQQIYGGVATPIAKLTAPPAPSLAAPPDEWRTAVVNQFQEDDAFLGADDNGSAMHRYPEAGARIDRPVLTTLAGEPVDHIRRGHTYYYGYTVTIASPLNGMRFGAAIKIISGLEIAGMASHLATERLARAIPGQRFKVRFRFRCALLPGTYFFNAGALALDGAGQEYFAHRLVDALRFRVVYEPDMAVNALVDMLDRVEIQEA